MEYRTWELSTGRGLSSAAIQTGVPIAALIGGVALAAGSEDPDVMTAAGVVVLIALVILLAFVVPMSWRTVERLANESARERGEIDAITPERMTIEARTALVKEQRGAAEAIARMSHDQLQYSIKLVGTDWLEINQEEGIVWLVGGVRVSVVFAHEWIMTWADKDGDLLPAESDWSAMRSRLSRQEWREAIQGVNGALYELGAIYLPASHYPARWRYPLHDQRMGALALIHLLDAAAMGGAIAEGKGAAAWANAVYTNGDNRE